MWPYYVTIDPPLSKKVMLERAYIYTKHTTEYVKVHQTKNDRYEHLGL